MSNFKKKKKSGSDFNNKKLSAKKKVKLVSLSRFQAEKVQRLKQGVKSGLVLDEQNGDIKLSKDVINREVKIVKQETQSVENNVGNPLEDYLVKELELYNLTQNISDLVVQDARRYPLNLDVSLI